MDTASTPEEEKVAHFLVDAAVWAVSVHNTQPWWFGTCGSTVTVHADADRRLEIADPDGREMLISCGAAVYTLRLAVCHLGHLPDVRMLSDPERPGEVAQVGVGPPYSPTADERQMYPQIRRRRGHRGGFRPGGLPAGLLQILRAQAYAERVSLRIVADPRARIALAALTEAAEQIQRRNPVYAAEAARWAPASGGDRPDGMDGDAYPRESARIDPHFAGGRDFARGQGWGRTDGERQEATGVVALLVTDQDGRADWLRAGQALQRILLCAAVHDVAAAFHTQALEMPDLRELIRTRFCDGACPQMIMRLGVAHVEAGGARRSVTELTRGEL
ncbi:MAG: hypothetical protein JWR24_3937 [Actinoallomurus sp.]|jgi:hypothetical protein|nr:hypothetical protein [Actinoallomurus sp.]